MNIIRRLLLIVAASIVAVAFVVQPVAARVIIPGSTSLPVDEETWCDYPTNSCASAYVHWDGAVTGFNQTVEITTLGASTYIPLAWNGGYIGVQKGGNSVTGLIGSTAVFSLGGTGVKIRKLPNGHKNPNCEGGFDSGDGASCRIHLTRKIKPGDVYHYQVTPENGGWLRGRIRLTTGQWLFIAELKPAPGADPDIEGLYNFVEDFGPEAATPADVPYSQVTFRHFHGSAVTLNHVSRIAGICAQADSDNAGGATVYFGGDTPC